MADNTRDTILEILREFSTPKRPVYMVGGAVRDLLLNRTAHDLDFVLPGRTRSLANEVACRLNGALYVLDEERDTTRVVLDLAERPGERLTLDFAALRAPDLESDLRARDFTINAMAVDVSHPDRLIDPTNGLADLGEKRIRACSPESLSQDPVRILRAIRQALSFHFRVDPETTKLMRAAAPLLANPSAERLRDELFRMLGGRRVSLSIRLLDQVCALTYVLPELETLKNISQTAPHVSDVWEHTLNVVQHLERLLASLVGSYQEESASDLTTGSAVLWLGRYRQQLEEHFSRRLVPDRSLRSLLFFAALYHDIAKPLTRTVSPEGKVHFLEHPELGAKLAVGRGRALALSMAEISRVETIVENHMRVHFLTDSVAKNAVAKNAVAKNAVAKNAGAKSAGEEAKPSRRSIYRFFKATGDAGVDICLISLADLLGTYETSLPQDLWQAELQTCRALLEAYWEKSEEVVSPPRYLTGNDLMKEFDLKPGRTVGFLLAAISEAQAVGEIHDRAEALSFAREWVQRHEASGSLSGEEGEE